MLPANDNKRIAQSASALGAGLLGFGLGASFGANINRFLILLVLILGGIIHIAGMYVLQMKNPSAKAGTMVRALWFTAWLCLLSLIALVVYLLLK